MPLILLAIQLLKHIYITSNATLGIHPHVVIDVWVLGNDMASMSPILVSYPRVSRKL